jgi:hypothetical protein
MVVIAQPLSHITIWHFSTFRTLGLSCDLHPSLHGALVVMVTAAMVIAAVVTTVMREVASLRWGDVMVVCDGNNARGCTVKNAGASITVEQFSCTWAALRGE